jgi:probable blue pigment (indigoidine) exporter
VIGTALAHVTWMTGLRLMPAGAVALIGLLNPVAGTLIGVVLAHEVFGTAQALGMLLVLGGVLAGQPAVHELLRPTRKNVVGAVDRACVPTP